MNYQEFLENKIDIAPLCGIEVEAGEVSPVCPSVAEALVRANLPEYCVRKLTSMEELAEAIVS